MKLEFIPLTSALNDKAAGRGVVFFVGDDLKLSPLAAQADKASGGLLKRALSVGSFKGEKGKLVSVLAPSALGADYAIFVGIGKEKDADALLWENAGGSLTVEANRLRLTSLHVTADAIPEYKKLKKGEAEARFVLGAFLRNWRFDKYRTKEKAEEKPTLQAIHIATEHTKQAEKIWLGSLQPLFEGILLTREVASEPANVIYPASLAERCLELADLGVEVEVLGEEQMQALGMGSLLGVGQGSVRESQLVVMQWKGGDKKQKPLAYVGKGVTFDTGGISIKPAGGMEEMKFDMCGSAAVIGALKALALRKAKVNVVGVVGLVENMPDGNAQRPGDVVTSMSGQTIEVINTDAEGRLVLADALWYTQNRFKPELIVDLATLTGAILIALGTSRAGLFSNNDKLADKLHSLGQKVGEELWRLPLGDVYDKQINSPVADMQNVGEGREAGSITAAQFLQRFVNDYPWAHLDIAGTAWGKKDSAICAKGATAFGVKLLDALAADYED